MTLEMVFEHLNLSADSLILKRAVVILLYVILALVAHVFIARVVRRLVTLTRQTIDDYLLEHLHGPVCWTIVLLGVQHALVLGTLEPPWATVLPASVESLMLFIWFLAGFKILNALVSRSVARTVFQGKIGTDLFLLLKNVARVLVIAMGLFWLLAIWEVDLTPLFASAGIAGIAVALAAKDSLANFFGGISIFADKSFKVGDYIIIDERMRGEVVEIGIRSTRIKTRDDVMVTIPNSILANSRIVNQSAPIPNFRIRIPVGVAYGSDVDQVEEVLLQAVHGLDLVVEEPSPRVRLRAFGDSSLDFELLVWIHDPSLKGRTTHLLLKTIYKLFAQHRIEIPFPQRDLHLRTVSGEAELPVRPEASGPQRRIG